MFLAQQVAPILFPSSWQLHVHNTCVLTQNMAWFGIAGWDVLHTCPVGAPKTVFSPHSVCYWKKMKQISLFMLVWWLPTSLLDSFFQPVKAEWWMGMKGWISTSLFAWLKICDRSPETLLWYQLTQGASPQLMQTHKMFTKLIYGLLSILMSV